MIKVLNEIDIENVSNLQKSNKHKKYFTGFAECCRYSTENREYLNNKGCTDLIWFNKRNTRDVNIIKKRKLTGHKKINIKKDILQKIILVGQIIKFLDQ